ncbi:MAG: immune inhibitor A domain-containing protein [Actinomycetales bacterium]
MSMRRVRRGTFLAAVSATAVAALTAAGSATPAAASAPSESRQGPQASHSRAHDLPSPLSEKQRALRKQALELQAKGKIAKGAKVGKVAKGQYVELARESEDEIFTVLGEFSDLAHNEIPKPDRAVDNTTTWAANYNRAHYLQLLFDDAPGANSMHNFYLEQSSGRYTVDGDVTDWVQVDKPAAYYGSNAKSDAYAWVFIQDELKAWVAQQKAGGKSDADIAKYLSRFDQWDRYDYDGDGNFNEPDGYIDHFETIHAGQGEEAGGGVLGDDAIWSHRWYAFSANAGKTGPAGNKLGGIKIPGTDFWVGDYTIEPENGGVGVFSHEFGHDLGLPDEYDTSGNSGGAENSTGFWTLMSSGSWGSTGKPEDGIGDQPFHMGAWDKWVLGWLNPAVLQPGDKAASVRLGPAEMNTKQSQAAVVVLPDKKVTTQVGAPATGAQFYYSGAANDLDTTMTRSLAVPVAAATLTAKVRYNIESDYDYAYIAVNGTKVKTSLSSSTVLPEGIDGSSDGWATLTVDLSAWAGQTVNLTVGYKTDGGAQGNADSDVTPGIALDDLTLGTSTDGAEAATGWTYSSNNAKVGFHITSGTETASYFNAYVAENRQYIGYDADLATGPYNFADASRPDWAERYPYEDGLLVWYYDSSFSNNNVGDHPGKGQILPVDAHPAVAHWNDGQVLRGRFQAYDATFGLEPTEAITLHSTKGLTATIRSQAPVSTFDDTRSYFVAKDPGDVLGHYQAGWLSVDHPHTGTKIQVVSQTKGGFMQIHVTPPPAK